MQLFFKLFLTFGLLNVVQCSPRPTVLWHGMGDTCCYPFSMGAIKGAIEQAIPGVYVYSIEIGDSIIEDEFHGFIGNVNSQVLQVCNQLKQDPNLKGGFNAVGFSQGSQFLRAYIERCNDPPVYNFITLGGQHQGVADIPSCVSANGTICSMVEELLDFGAYNSLAQDLVVQAQYFHDPMDVTSYYAYNKFLPDINNELSVNQTYKNNILSLNNFVLIMFSQDTVVVPRESAWFGFYQDGNLNNIIPFNMTRLYQQDLIGIKTLDQAGKLKFDSAPGNHMQFSLDWFGAHVIGPYLKN
eukprot:TRINITY_DN3161_c2_g1_i1.p1 TRINITY_DN3161_c2_g1~~TRINITY_DN3161_c2_g1_i1.p1  ORF type:complete len:298 (+),score=47.91 TRINITY_DN3161_c2_g1_i1:119-1012(+)